MKKVLGLSLLLYCCYCVNGQAAFQKISYEKALKKAAKENKLIFLQYESENCARCNDVANAAFTDEKLKQDLSQKFIAIRMEKDNPARDKLDGIFNIKGRMGTLYIDENERLVHRSSMTSSQPRYYTNEMKVAEKKYSTQLQLDADSISYFVQGKKDIHIIKRIIQTKTDLGQETDLLLVEYTNLLPADSVNTTSTLQFIARQSPVLDTKLDLMMRRASNFNSAWYAMPLNERININNRIISKSVKIAAREKDEERAKKIARFARGTVAADSAGINMYYDWNMMSYYLQTKNYDQYLPIAANYYSRTFAGITPQIIYNADSVKLKNNLNSEAVTSYFVSSRNDYASQMLSAAERFYHLDKENKYASQSLSWVKRSIDLNPSYRNKHLYARMLYKSGKSEMAIQEETEAIALIEKTIVRGSIYSDGYVESYYAALEKMKKGEPLGVEGN